MAARFPPAVLVQLTHVADQLSEIPLPNCDGYRRNPKIAANAWLEAAGVKLDRARVHWAFDEQAIRVHATNYASRCRRMRSFESRCWFAASLHVAVPSGRFVTPESASRRMGDPRWWRRQLRKRWTRSSEDAFRELGLVRAGRAPYVSDQALRHMLACRRRQREWMDSMSLVSEDGEVLSLLSLHDRSLANPALRRGEFMCRMRGFEELANARNDDALFVTLTAPSAFHAQLKAGAGNPAFERQSVRAAQFWLRKMFARFRARMHRRGIEMYGFRVAEPHHDGTPHWHAILFFSPEHAPTVSKELREVWLSEYSHEPGADAARVKLVRPDPNKGSPTGYIAKYVAKNIDGAGSIGDDLSDETGRPVTQDVSRVVAWANLHGIRQFQQIGGPPVGIWREARRLKSESLDADIERVRVAAKAGEWCAFIQACLPNGGRLTTVRLEIRQTPGLNTYGEPKGAEIYGLASLTLVELTRPVRWQLEQIEKPPNSSLPLDP